MIRRLCCIVPLAWLHSLIVLPLAVAPPVYSLTCYGRLGSGDRPARYNKRPLSLALTFVLAHLPTQTLLRKPLDFLGKATLGTLSIRIRRFSSFDSLETPPYL
jgi:hypothetical protein